MLPGMGVQILSYSGGFGGRNIVEMLLAKEPGQSLLKPEELEIWVSSPSITASKHVPPLPEALVV